MVDLLGIAFTAALIVFAVATLLAYMDIPRVTKAWFAAIVGIWVGIAAAAAAAGWLSISRPAPVIGLFVVVPLIAAVLLARRALMSLPLSLMVGLNVARVFAFLFLILEAQGRLSGPFPFSAAWGDIITGVLAVPMLWLARDPARNALALHAWNLFGLADLVAAIGLGVTSSEGSALQIFAAPGSAAMTTLPWSFVPTVLVPLWMIMHGVIFAQLRRAASLGDSLSPTSPARG
jgi:hypothetical protein